MGPHHLKPWIVQVRKQSQVNPDVVATKMRFDPLGLLANVAAGKVALATLPRF